MDQPGLERSLQELLFGKASQNVGVAWRRSSPLVLPGPGPVGRR